MKRTHITAKALSLLLAFTVLLSTFGVACFAGYASLDKQSLGGAYGDIVPTDEQQKTQRTSFTFYGNSTSLYFRLFSKGKSDANCAVEIYSEKDCNEDSLVTSYSNTLGAAGDRTLSIAWSFKLLHSGTYYGKSYIYVNTADGDVIDSTTVRSFTVNIDRIGKQQVALDSVSNVNGGVKIKWAALTTATKYAIYRKEKAEDSWVKIYTAGASATSYTDKTAKSGKTYIYTVKAYDGSFASLYNKAGLTVFYLATPVLKSAAGTGAAGAATVTWGKVSGAKGYYVYRKGGALNESSWKRIASVGADAVSYKDTTATSTDWRYTYTVKAYNGAYTSSYQSAGIDFNYMKAPVLQSVAVENGSLVVNWSDSSAVAEKYYVYRKAAGEKSWTKIGTTAANSFADKNVTSGTTYTYTVKASAATNDGAYNGTGISSLYLATPVVSSVSFAANGSATVKWGAIKGAQGYYLYKKTNGGSWERIATIKSGSTVSYVDKSAKESGSKYAYTLKAYNGKVTSKNKTSETFIYLTNPVLALENVNIEGVDSVKITWEAVPGAVDYRVYRKAPGETSWQIIKDKTEDTEFIDSDVTGGTVYSYTVKAFNGSSTSKYTSFEIIALTAPVLENAVITEDGIKITWAAVEGADSYYVLRKAAAGDEFEQIGSYSLNEFTDTDAAALTEGYIYTVAAASGEVLSDYDKDGIAAFAAVYELKAEVTETENGADIILSWSGTENAAGYKVYRSINGEGAELAAELSAEETTYTDTDIIQGAVYSYNVWPVSEGKVNIGANANTKWAFPPVEAVEFEITYSYGDEETPASLNIGWQAVDFAESYEIYRRTADGEFELIATVSDALSFADTDILLDTEYTYTVKGVASDRDSLYNEEGLSAAIYTPLSPVGFTVTLVDDEEIEGSKAVKVEWNADENAVYYQIMRKTADTDWEVADFEIYPAEYAFIDYDIEQGVEYTYTVQAFAFDRASVHDEEGKSIIWEPAEEPGEGEEPTVPGEGEEPAVPGEGEEPAVPGEGETPEAESGEETGGENLEMPPIQEDEKYVM